MKMLPSPLPSLPSPLSWFSTTRNSGGNQEREKCGKSSLHQNSSEQIPCVLTAPVYLQNINDRARTKCGVSNPSTGSLSSQQKPGNTPKLWLRWAVGGSRALNVGPDTFRPKLMILKRVILLGVSEILFHLHLHVVWDDLSTIFCNLILI